MFYIILCLFICLCILLLMALPIWKIQEVSVSGTQILSAEEIKDLSSIPLNENLFFASFARAHGNLKKITAIESFHIFRLPPRTVLIKITERQPMTVLVMKNRSAVIDKEGFILNRNQNLTLNIPNMTDLPVISGIGSQEAGGGDRIDPKISALLSDIITELSNLAGSRQIQVDVGGFRKISFLLNDILRVKIGSGENVKRKMAIFKKLLPVIANKWLQVEYLDVRYPDNPVIKYR